MAALRFRTGKDDILKRYRSGLYWGSGVGLAGMRERLSEVPGSLEVERGRGGTLLRAKIPTSGCYVAPQKPLQPTTV